MLPITIRRPVEGANGRNWPGVVVLDPKAPMPAAVWAQEAYEALHKLNPVNLIRVRLSRRYRRRMEVMGHEIEVQAAALIYGEDADRYRAREARAMQRGYDGLFTNIAASQLAMEAVSADASRWVRRRRDKIERWMI